MTISVRTCLSCGTPQTENNTYRLKSGKFSTNCRKCSNTKSRSWYHENTNKQIQWSQNWHNNNPGMNRYNANTNRAKKKGCDVPLTPVEVEWMKFYYSEAFTLTKETGVPTEVDHIKPICKGGPHAPWNLQILTESENRKKFITWPLEVS